jgi:predicted DsbA family dithiol-disulfide isomerase
VIRAAEAAGVQQDVVAALFRAYFQEGLDIGAPAVLDAVAEGAGLSGMAGMLAGPDHREEVLAEDMAARQGGISGVPSFLMDRYVLFSGAMPAERMAEAFRQADAALAARKVA